MNAIVEVIGMNLRMRSAHAHTQADGCAACVGKLVCPKYNYFHSSDCKACTVRFLLLLSGAMKGMVLLLCAYGSLSPMHACAAVFWPTPETQEVHSPFALSAPSMHPASLFPLQLLPLLRFPQVNTYIYKDVSSLACCLLVVPRRKLASIPFPFPWAQTIVLLLLLFTLTLPLLMSAFVDGLWMSMLLTFLPGEGRCTAHTAEAVVLRAGSYYSHVLYSRTVALP